MKKATNDPERVRRRPGDPVDYAEVAVVIAGTGPNAYRMSRVGEYVASGETAGFRVTPSKLDDETPPGGAVVRGRRAAVPERGK